MREYRIWCGGRGTLDFFTHRQERLAREKLQKEMRVERAVLKHQVERHDAAVFALSSPGATDRTVRLQEAR
jgi:hypothetical protein